MTAPVYSWIKIKIVDSGLLYWQQKCIIKETNILQGTCACKLKSNFLVI